MAKSKNHTNHNQNKKAHKNGIKKPASNRYPSLKGVCTKFRRNQNANFLSNYYQKIRWGVVHVLFKVCFYGRESTVVEVRESFG
ncbi:ribosomal L29e protein family-domain-containing protein [Phakopsora pachyrhizi]|uniref:60S ribosomal protein L29 n=1 Tax=Phakopsora pachyrhizi TaxID=170000 RepID=A0AAV0B3H6_PHAPC|nr:ribosomal L29e protein family-domain-containing protein [Phakopsora pachyrhizi]